MRKGLAVGIVAALVLLVGAAVVILATGPREPGGGGRDVAARSADDLARPRDPAAPRPPRARAANDTASPTRTGTIHGVVRAAGTGDPVAGALVLAFNVTRQEAPSVAARATSGRDGRFEIAVTSATGLAVTAAGHAPAFIFGSALADGVVVEMTAGATIVGTVLSLPDGATPVAGARVLALALPVLDPSLRVSAETTADGTFRIEHVAPIRTRVLVAEGDLVSAPQLDRAAPVEVDLAEGRETQVTLFVAATARIDGTVTDPDGGPVADARAWTRDAVALLLDPGARRGPHEAATGADGRFAMSVPPGPGVEVWVAAQGFVLARVRTPELEPGATVPLAVRLARGVALEVRVVDATTGEGVSSARVRCTLAADGRPVTDPEDHACDADGRAVVPGVPAGSVRVSAQAAGYLPVEGVTVEVARTAPEPVVVKLRAASTIEGVVVHADGTPVARATVRRRRIDDDAPAAADATADDADADASPDTWLDEHMHEVHADLQGRFRFDELTAGRWRVLVVSRGDDERVLGSADVATGARDVRIVLADDIVAAEAARGVRMRVLDPDGDEVKRFGSCVETRTANSSGTETLASREGAFTVDAPADAEVAVSVFDARNGLGFARDLGHVRVVLPHPRPATLDVTMPVAVAIEGRVVGPDGRGVGGLTVQAHVPGIPRRPETRGIAEARTDGDGAFGLERLGPADYDVVVVAGAEFVAPAPVVARGGATGVVVTLVRAARPVVTVLDADGRPVEGAWVAARRPDVASPPNFASSPGARTDASGRARLGSLDPGSRFGLDVTPPDGRRDVFRGHLDDWLPADVEVRLERQLDVTGVVRTQTGDAIPGATVWRQTRAADGTWPSQWGGSQCDAAGRFRIEGLHAGASLRLSAAPSFGAPGPPEVSGRPATIEVAAGTHDVVVTLDVGASIRLRLDGPDDVGGDDEGPFDGVPVSAGPGRAAVPEGVRTGRVALLRGLDPAATYTVLVGPSSKGRCALVRDVVPDGREVVVRLAACKPLAGRVVGDVAALKARHLFVRAMLDGAVRAQVACAKTGTFRFAGLPAGRWTVEAIVMGDAGWEVAGSAEAEPGSTDVQVAAEAR